MSDVRIRPAITSDVPAIERVARESWHAAYDDVLGSEAVDEVVSEWYARDGLREAAKDDDHVVPVAADSDGVFGFAHAGPHAERDPWCLFRLYVVPERWGNGTGTALLDRVESELGDRGVTTCELAVLAENDVGVSFYESRGFDRFETDEVELAGVETTEYWYRKEL